MDFGQIQNSQAHFVPIPKDDPRAYARVNEQLSKASPEDEASALLYFGCPVWNCAEWKGSVFPPETPVKSFLQAYAKVFNSIELNSTHYMTPSRDQVEKWCAQITPGFKFCPKWPQRISHSFFDKQRDSFAQEFADSVAHFSDHLGLTFLQMPPTFKWSSREDLFEFLAKFSKSTPIALELRHASWFNGPHYKEELYQFMVNHNISPVITDTLGRRDCVHSSLTTDKLIIRFLGNELHPSDSERLFDWTERLRSWQELGLTETYFFAHQPDNVLAPKTLELFAQHMNEQISEDIIKVQFYEEPQSSLF